MCLNPEYLQAILDMQRFHYERQDQSNLENSKNMRTQKRLL